MKNRLKKLVKNLVNFASRMRKWASKNWFKYTCIKTVYFTLLFPLMFSLIAISAFFGYVSVVILVIGLFAVILLDSKRISVAQEYPDIFVKTEKFENILLKLFFVVYILLFVPIIFLSTNETLSVESGTIPTIMLPIMSIWVGILLTLEFNWIESSSLWRAFADKIGVKRYRHLLDFMPSDALRAKARFSVVAKVLSQNPNEDEINSKFPLFWEGMTIYHNNIRRDFNLAIRDSRRFYCYAKLVSYEKTDDNIIETQLNSMTKLMEKEKTEPFEFVKLLKTIVNEPTTREEVFKEIEVEPKLIRKWFSTNSDSIKLVLAVVSPILSILLAIFGI